MICIKVSSRAFLRSTTSDLGFDGFEIVDVKWPGLDQDEAERRLLAAGPNIPSPVRARSLGRILLSILKEPIFLLLVVAVGLYLSLGSRAEGLLLTLAAVGTISLVVVQQARIVGGSQPPPIRPGAQGEVRAWRRPSAHADDVSRDRRACGARSAFSITSSELAVMATAAPNGDNRPKAARGRTMML